MDIETHVVPSSSLKVDVHLPTKRPAGKLAAIFAIHPGASVRQRELPSGAPVQLPLFNGR
jgi:hypothetical protein